MRRLIILVTILILGISLVGCDAIGGLSNSIASHVEAKVTNIHFSTNPNATHVVIDVEVIPKNALPDKVYFICLLSRDGYYFGSLGGREMVSWTEEELQGPDENERDYYKIQEAEERKIRRFSLGAPLTDKDVVALQEDCKLEAEKLLEEHARELWQDVVEGDLVEFFIDADKDPDLTQSEINRIFNRHLELVIVDKEGYLEIEYPDGEIVKLGEFSGQGSFRTPKFIPKYEWLRITITSTTGCYGEGGLYHSNGQGAQWGTFNVASNHEGTPRRLHVEPGKEYYYTFSISDDMVWHLIIEESNMDIWLEEMKYD